MKRYAINLLVAALFVIGGTAYSHAAATDDFATLAPSLDAPAIHAVAVTPSDGSDLTYVSRGVYVGGAGDIKVTLLGGETVTFSAVPAGTLLPVRASRIWSTGTTATNLVSVR